MLQTAGHNLGEAAEHYQQDYPVAGAHNQHSRVKRQDIQEEGWGVC